MNLIDSILFNGVEGDSHSVNIDYLKNKKIRIKVDGCVELFLNSYNNEPPSIIDNSETLVIRNCKTIEKLCFNLLKDL